jgi:hypothetical protein
MQLTKLFPKDKFLSFWQEKPVRIATRISFAILFFALGFLLLTWKSLPPRLPLFYSLPWGEEQLGKPIFLLILPLSSLFWGILNFSLAVFSFERQPLAAKILVWATTWLTFLATITLVKIILLIT